MVDADWHPVGTAYTRRQCPLCDWHMDEPPMETATEWTGVAMVVRVRQHSALPAAAAHVITEHPDSEVARQLRQAAEEHVRRRGSGTMTA